MSWGITDDIVTTNVDASGDSPATARADIKNVFDKVKAMLAKSPAMEPDANNFTAMQTIAIIGPQLTLKAATSDGAFVALNPEQAAPTTRRGRVGFLDGNTLTIENEKSNQNLNLKTAGTGVVQANGNTIWHSGNFEKDYDLAFQSLGVVPNSEVVFILTAARGFNLPQNLSGSQAKCNTAPSGGSVVYDIQKNGVSIGSITFADTATSATFTFSTSTNFVAGDILKVISPSNTRSMASLGVTFKATLT